MWRDIGLLGRDRLLQSEVYPRALGKKAAFILVGQRGVGKSAILEWSHENAPGKRAILSATWTVRENLIAVAEGWRLTITDGTRLIPPARATMAMLERRILQEKGGQIFIDDIQEATPAFIRRLKIWRERFSVFCAGAPPFRKEQLKRQLWGLKEIMVEPLEETAGMLVAERVCTHLGSTLSPSELAQSSRGLPGRIVLQALTGEIEATSPRVAGEEINLAPVLLLVLGMGIAYRYLGAAFGDTAMYLVGGISMAGLLAARYFFYQGQRE